MRVGGQTLARVATLIDSHQLSSSFDRAFNSNHQMENIQSYSSSILFLIFIGKTVEEVINCKSFARVQWSLFNPGGISFPFDGIPFVCVGTINYQCHQGEDVDKITKIRRAKERDEKDDHDHTFRKRRKHFQCTKKLGCPSKVFMSRIFKFPEYKVR